MHTYDLRTSEYLGHLDQITVTIDRSSPLVVARRETAVDGVHIQENTHAVPGQQAKISVQVLDSEGAACPDHLVRIRVEDPHGEQVSCYSGLLHGGDGMEWIIPFALNDTPGVWKVFAIDAVSGKEDVAEIELAHP